MNKKESWMQTFTGKKFFPFDPKAEDVNIKDIAHSLSLQCRFNGHCKRFYSVAQHSVLVSLIVKPEQKLAALLHDAAETYFGDIIRPVRKNIKQIQPIEDKILKTILEHFKIKNYDENEILKADNIVLITEKRDLLSQSPDEWKEAKGSKPFPKKIRALPPKIAEEMFLKRYQKLKACRGI